MQRSEILIHVKKHVEVAASRLSAKIYDHENEYVNAFIEKLDGVIDLGDGSGRIDIRCKFINSEWSDTAESKFGAGFALCFESVGARRSVKKAVIAQAKTTRIDKVSKRKEKRLELQCKKMSLHTEHYLCFETPTMNGDVPFVLLGAPETGGLKNDRIRFDEYIVDCITSSTHGDKKENFFEEVSFSGLTKLEITSENLSFEPDGSSSSEPSQSFALN